MQKTILVTGATDGIGLETAKMLVGLGHNVLLHGRTGSKVEKVEQGLRSLGGEGRVEGYVADLSRMADVQELARAINAKYDNLDILINNAGVFVVPEPVTEDGLDVRFVVNTIAPYLLTKKLLPLMQAQARIINLSSAAQAAVHPDMMTGVRRAGSDGDAYAQSKLALTMWSRALATSLGDTGPSVIAVNPKSFLGSKMVKQAYGAQGGDLRIGAEILCRAALSDDFSGASGKYFDNDIGSFSTPHPDALSEIKCKNIVELIESILSRLV